MMEEARVHEAEDQQRRAEVETRNQADSLAYSTEKLLQDNADNIPEHIKTEVEGKLTALRTAMAGGAAAEIQAAMNDLNESLQRMGEAVYSQSSRPAGGADVDDVPTDDSTPADADDTVEGEFREV